MHAVPLHRPELVLFPARDQLVHVGCQYESLLDALAGADLLSRREALRRLHLVRVDAAPLQVSILTDVGLRAAHRIRTSGPAVAHVVSQLWAQASPVRVVGAMVKRLARHCNGLGIKGDAGGGRPSVRMHQLTALVDDSATSYAPWRVEAQIVARLLPHEALEGERVVVLMRLAVVHLGPLGEATL